MYATAAAGKGKRKPLDADELIETAAQKRSKRVRVSDCNNNFEPDEYQRAAIDAAIRHENYILLGEAGTGKSFTIKKMREAIEDICPGDEIVALVAPTGNAAANIGGITLHKLLGLPIEGYDARVALKKIQKNKTVFQIWKSLYCIIIDEGYMVDARLFDLIDVLARHIRNRLTENMGGIQIIFSGDCFQLPPVNGIYTFKGASFRRTLPKVYELKISHRHTGQAILKHHLDKLRVGKVDTETTAYFRSLNRDINPLMADGQVRTKEPVRLFATRARVESVNRARLESILADQSVERQSFKSSSTITTSISGYYEDKFPVAKEVVLCVGARVLLVKNIMQEAGLVNGLTGTVVGFENKLPVVLFDKFDYEVTIEYYDFEITNLYMEVIAHRCQIPLVHAWALTIHKAQGATFESVEVDLSGVFEEGQVYVALSRCPNPDNMKVVNFDPRKVRVSQDVTNFYTELTNGTYPGKIEDVELFGTEDLDRKETPEESKQRKISFFMRNKNKEAAGGKGKGRGRAQSKGDSGETPSSAASTAKVTKATKASSAPKKPAAPRKKKDLSTTMQQNMEIV